MSTIRRPRPRQHSRQASVEYPRYPPLNSPTQQPPQFERMLSATNLAMFQPSEYASDDPTYVSDYPPSNLPVIRTKEELNLSVIRKHNPEIVRILALAPYATIYDWAHTPGEWQKTGPNGTLFICQLTQGEYGEDRYHAVVLNRSGLDNFNAEIRKSDLGSVEVSGDYVIITQEPQEPGGAPKANAIHIFSEEGTSTDQSRVTTGGLMVALAEDAKTSRDAAMARFTHQDGISWDTIELPQQSSSALETTSLQQHPQQPTSVQPHYPTLQPSPVPPMAPQPTRQSGLLALFQNQQSQPPPRPESRDQSLRQLVEDVEAGPIRPQAQARSLFQAQGSADANNLLRLLQGGGGTPRL